MIDFQPDDDNEQIDFKIDFQPDEKSSSKPSGVKRAAKDAVGGVDAALNMLASAPSYVASGVAGLSTLLGTGSIDKAGDTVKRVQESNFGFGKPKPITKEGEEVMEMISHGMESVKGKAGDLGYQIGGELGRTNAEIAAESILNFLPIPGAVGVTKAARAIEGKLAKKPAPVAKPKVSDIIEQKATAAKTEARKANVDMSDPFRHMKQQLDTPQRLPTESPVMDSVVRGLEEGGPNQRAWEADDVRAQRQAEMEFEVKRRTTLERNAAERARQEQAPTWTEGMDRDAVVRTMDEDPTLASRTDETSQMELFDQPEQGRVANPYEAKLGDWRVDENGMPIKADLSMELANLENPLQRNLWGDELPMTRSAEGQNAPLGMDRDLMGYERLTKPDNMPENDIPLTNAIDSMENLPWKSERDVAIERLQQDITADPILERAKRDADNAGDPTYLNTGFSKDDIVRSLEAYADKLRKGEVAPIQDPERLINSKTSRGRQTGAVNPEVFKEGFQKLKQLADGTWLRAYYDPDMKGLNIEAYKDGHIVGEALFDSMPQNKMGMDLVREMDGVDPYTVHPPESLHMESFSTEVKDEFRRQGYASELYKFASELGNDVKPSTVQSKDGKAMWDGFERKGLAEKGAIPYIPKGQRGSIDLNAISEGIRGLISGIKPMAAGERAPRKGSSPEEIASREKGRAIARRFPVEGALDEFDVINTPEEAIAMAKNAKDIAADYVGQKSLGSGINFQVIMSNNPLLKFARTKFRDARSNADAFSREFISDKKVGLSSLWNKMNDAERVEVMEGLQAADRHQYKLGKDVMEEAGFSEAQWQFVDRFYAADEALYTTWEAKMAEVGLKVPERRTGHFPGIFKGSYKAIVFDKSGKRALAIVAADTKAQFNMGLEHFKQEFPEATIKELDRRGLQGSKDKYYSDLFSGVSDVLDVIAEHDPRFSEIKGLVDKAMRKANNHLYNFNVHELAKRGVVGNEGNKPWRTKIENANEAFRALVDYFEEGSLHHELQPVLKDIDQMITSPELRQSHPNAVGYLQEYIGHIKGQNLAFTGRAMNSLVDGALNLMPNLTWHDGKLSGGIGIGAAPAMKLTGAVKNNMSQIFMGWFNYMFTAAQMAQPLQTGLPFMQLAATRLGVGPEVLTKSMGTGLTHSLMAWLEDFSGKQFDNLPQESRIMYEYAKQRGLFTFSEMERAYQGTQGRISAAKDTVAELNMKLGESMTRTPMFMAFADLLLEGGVPIERALPIAENLTQTTMIDYHKWERPMFYQKQGIAGTFAGGLTTFKHGLLSQQTYLGKQAIKPATKLVKGEDGTYSPEQMKRQFLPIAAAIATMGVFAGITGAPFYSEMDSMVRSINNKFFGESKGIREMFLQDLPEWMNSGAVSAATDLNLQGKFSSADMIPDTVNRALSPHGDAFAKIVGNAIDVAKNGDDQAVRNFLLSTTPSGWKGVTEHYTARDEQNFLIGKDGQRVLKRDDKEWNQRIATGLRPQREALERDDNWSGRLKKKADDERKIEIYQEYKRSVINGTMSGFKRDKLLREYRERGGDEERLLNLDTDAKIESKQTEKQRLQGEPGGTNWQYFNKRN